MDYRFTPEEEAFRQEIRSFLKAELPKDAEQGEEAGSDDEWQFARKFQKKLAAKGPSAHALPSRHHATRALRPGLVVQACAGEI